jgi:hypothetical protein
MYFCMTELKIGQHSNIIHGEPLLKNSAENAALQSNYVYNTCRIVSWVEKADTPHRCDVFSCKLNRIYFRNKLHTISIKLMLYDVCKKVLEKRLPDDIVLYIMKKCFYKKVHKYIR